MRIRLPEQIKRREQTNPWLNLLLPRDQNGYFLRVCPMV